MALALACLTRTLEGIHQSCQSFTPFTLHEPGFEGVDNADAERRIKGAGFVMQLL